MLGIGLGIGVSGGKWTLVTTPQEPVPVNTTTYLSMDGVDDYFQAPSLTYTKFIMDVSIDQVAAKNAYYFDARTGTSGYLLRNTSGTDQFVANSIFVNGVQKSSLTAFIPNNERVIVEVRATAPPVTDDVTFFARNNFVDFMKGKIFSIEFYNGTTIVAKYDMSKGSVQDHSGNGKHGVLSGGTWI